LSLIQQTATELKRRLQRREISPLDLIDALEQRIAAVDPAVNALPTLCLDRAREHAKRLQDLTVEERGLLCGLPVAIKDLEPVAGVRSTWGSPIFSDFIPTASDCVVDANTFNEVFGRTLNPWNTAKSCAGSSGGSAVALATGSAWLATGSDLGGSLRNPASFCSIVGFRPSPGRVAHGPAAPGAYPAGLGGMPSQPFAVAGPMARNVPDVALLLDAMSGVHPADTSSMPREAISYVTAVEAALARETTPLRVAFSKDFGITPVDPEVARIAEQAVRRFEDFGCRVDVAHPDFSDMEDIFQTNRAMMFYVSQKRLLQNKREDLKPEVIWNIEKARAVSMDDIERVENARGAYIQRATQFFDQYDLLLSPATIVPPYPAQDRFVESCEGVKFDNYIQWCSIAYAITITGFPALSVPAGFTGSGLPVGLQIVAGPRQEAALLGAAAMYERISGLAAKVPMDPVINNADP